MSGTLRGRLESALAGQPVLVTGHTGFKGTWLTLWLAQLGAKVWGYALAPDTEPAAFDRMDVASRCHRHVIADVRDAATLRRVLRDAAPRAIFHLAAQPLVRRSYDEPHYTLETNVMGTANLLEAIRLEGLPTALVVVTSDKCYENREWLHAYRETDPLGGHDLYSTSKAAAELVTAGYRQSFFPPERLAEHGVAVASARAGNVIGGGDWAAARIVPDSVAALAAGRAIPVRNPSSVRPWQHVLDPLAGYLLLAARLCDRGSPEQHARFCEPYNFGPSAAAARPVRDVVEGLIDVWGEGSWDDCSKPGARHEGGQLRLAIDKTVASLGWQPRWDLRETLARTAGWYQAHYSGATGEELVALSHRQIEDYLDEPDGNRRE